MIGEGEIGQSQSDSSVPGTRETAIQPLQNMVMNKFKTNFTAMQRINHAVATGFMRQNTISNNVKEVISKHRQTMQLRRKHSSVMAG